MPLSMISFVVSLFVVERQQRQWRLSQHTSSPDSLWARLTHWPWLNPEPYQDSKDTTWKYSDNVAAQDTPGTVFRGWYTRKKHRAMAKMEISDAFEMRRRVIFALVAWALLGALGISYVARRMYGWISRT